jgi:hypothetical protein
MVKAVVEILPWVSGYNKWGNRSSSPRWNISRALVWARPWTIGDNAVAVEVEEKEMWE